MSLNKVLGIVCTNNLKHIVQIYIIRKCWIGLKDSWKERGLTPVGKIEIITSLIHSKLIHLSQLSPPKQLVQVIESIFLILLEAKNFIKSNEKHSFGTYEKGYFHSYIK